MFKDPFDPDALLGRRCRCGGDHSESEHGRLVAEAVPAGEEARWNRVVDAAVLRAVFPVDAQRRLFLKTVGAATAMAAISSVLPLAAAREAFAQGGAPEKKDLKVGFIPITCATPHHHGPPDGLLCQARARRRSGEDGGLGGDPRQVAGQGIRRRRTCSRRCRSPSRWASARTRCRGPCRRSRTSTARRSPWRSSTRTSAIPKDWKGFKFAVPFDYSMHNYLLRYYVAEHGLDPDKDISIRSVPPPEMVANLRADNIDGFLGPDPFNQRAVYDGVGFIHLLTKELWDGHPCCAFAVSKEFASQNPNTYRALLKAIIEATAYRVQGRRTARRSPRRSRRRTTSTSPRRCSSRS